MFQINLCSAIYLVKVLEYHVRVVEGISILEWKPPSQADNHSALMMKEIKRSPNKSGHLHGIYLISYKIWIYKQWKVFSAKHGMSIQWDKKKTDLFLLVRQGWNTLTSNYYGWKWKESKCLSSAPERNSLLINNYESVKYMLICLENCLQVLWNSIYGN